MAGTKVRVATWRVTASPQSRMGRVVCRELLREVNHYYAYAAKAGDDLNATKENLWQFCRTALGA